MGAIAAATVLGFACGDGSRTGGTGGPVASGSSAVRPAAPVKRTGPAAPSREGSTLSRSPTDDALFLADEDHSCVRVAALPLGDDSPIERTEMPGRPAQVLATGAQVLVTIRGLPNGKGALLIMERAGKLGLSEKARIELPSDAWGIALSPDESLAIVTSAWTSKVSIIDLDASKVLSTLDVAREPRGVTILPSGDTAFISHLVGSSVTRLEKLREASPQVSRLEVPASPSRSPKTLKLSASLGYSVVASPDGTRVYFPRHALGAVGRHTWFGTAAVDVLDAISGKPFAPVRQEPPLTLAQMFQPSDLSQAGWWDTSDDVIEAGNGSFVQPRATVYRKSTDTLLVASEGSDSVVELDALMSDPTVGVVRGYGLSHTKIEGFELYEQGGAPSGLALSSDERTLFVHCRSTDELAVVALPPGEGPYESRPATYRKLTDEKVERDAQLGRQLFYLSYHVVSGGLGCAGCHPDGRDDGHVWRETTLTPEGGKPFTNFFGSIYSASYLVGRWPTEKLKIETTEPQASGHARQTPMLAGRVSAKGPYGWLGESKDLEARLVGGFGLHRWETDDASEGLKIAMARMIAKFLQQGLVPPPVETHPLTDEERKGKAIFLSPEANCASCHAPDTDYTNRSVAALALAGGPPGFVAEKNAAYKTPSLLFIGGTAPYFHDGRYATLEELVEKNGAQMGKTSHLDAEQKKALVAFLKTL